MQLIQHPWFQLANPTATDIGTSTATGTAIGTTITATPGPSFDWRALIHRTLPSALYPPTDSPVAVAGTDVATTEKYPPQTSSRMLFPYQAARARAQGPGAPAPVPVDLSHYSRLRVTADTYRRNAQEVAPEAQREFDAWDYNRQFIFRPPQPTSAEHHWHIHSGAATAPLENTSGEAQMRRMFGLNSPPGSKHATPAAADTPIGSNHRRSHSDPVSRRCVGGADPNPKPPEARHKRKLSASENPPPRTPPSARQLAASGASLAATVNHSGNERMDRRLLRASGSLTQAPTTAAKPIKEPASETLNPPTRQSPSGSLKISIPPRDEALDSSEKIPSAALQRHMQVSSKSA